MAWAAAIWAAPGLGTLTSWTAPVAGTIYLIGSLICHQLPQRSFHLAGAQLPVCARCTGLYLGAAIGVASLRLWTWIVQRPPAYQRIDGGQAARLLLVASLPTCLTLATAAIGWWDPSNAIRFTTALPLGAVAGAVLAAVASNDLR